MEVLSLQLTVNLSVGSKEGAENERTSEKGPTSHQLREETKPLPATEEESSPEDGREEVYLTGKGAENSSDQDRLRTVKEKEVSEETVADVTEQVCSCCW